MAQSRYPLRTKTSQNPPKEAKGPDFSFIDKFNTNQGTENCAQCVTALFEALKGKVKPEDVKAVAAEPTKRVRWTWIAGLNNQVINSSFIVDDDTADFLRELTPSLFKGPGRPVIEVINAEDMSIERLAVPAPVQSSAPKPLKINLFKSTLKTLVTDLLKEAPLNQSVADNPYCPWGSAFGLIVFTLKGTQSKLGHYVAYHITPGPERTVRILDPQTGEIDESRNKLFSSHLSNHYLETVRWYPCEPLNGFIRIKKEALAAGEREVAGSRLDLSDSAMLSGDQAEGSSVNSDAKIAAPRPVLSPEPEATALEAKRADLRPPLSPPGLMAIPRSDIRRRALDLAALSLEDDEGELLFPQPLAVASQEAESENPAPAAALATSESRADVLAFSPEKMVMIFSRGFQGCENDPAVLKHFFDNQPVMMHYMDDPILQLQGKISDDLARRLKHAVFVNNELLMEQLLRLKKLVTLEEAGGWFTLACEKWEVDCRKTIALILNKIAPDFKKQALNHLLANAVILSHAQLVEFALTQGADPNIRNKAGVSLLQIAAARHGEQIDLHRKSLPGYSLGKNMACRRILKLLQPLAPPAEQKTRVPPSGSLKITTQQIGVFKTKFHHFMGDSAQLKRLLDANRATLEYMLKNNIEIESPAQINQHLVLAISANNAEHVQQLLRVKNNLSFDEGMALLVTVSEARFIDPEIIKIIVDKLVGQARQQLLDQGFVDAILNANLTMAAKLADLGAKTPEPERRNSLLQTIPEVIKLRRDECMSKSRSDSSKAGFWVAKAEAYDEAMGLFLERSIQDHAEASPLPSSSSSNRSAQRGFSNSRSRPTYASLVGALAPQMPVSGSQSMALEDKFIPRSTSSSSSSAVIPLPPAGLFAPYTSTVLNGETELVKAIYSNNLDLFSRLIRAGTDVNQPDSGGSSPLMLAIVRGRHEMVQQLLQLDPAVNMLKSEKGATALSLAKQYYGNNHEITKAIERHTASQSPQAAELLRAYHAKGRR